MDGPALLFIILPAKTLNYLTPLAILKGAKVTC
jgi:hypothetical protein